MERREKKEGLIGKNTMNKNIRNKLLKVAEDLSITQESDEELSIKRVIREYRNSLELTMSKLVDLKKKIKEELERRNYLVEKIKEEKQNLKDLRK